MAISMSALQRHPLPSTGSEVPLTEDWEISIRPAQKMDAVNGVTASCSCGYASGISLGEGAIERASRAAAAHVRDRHRRQ